jgi:soluble lytic murein transglycosylase-like protein
MVKRAAAENDLDPLLVASIIWVESHWNPKALGNRGSVGLMQVRPIVVQELTRVHQLPADATVENLMEPDLNIWVGSGYFRHVQMQLEMNPERAARIRHWFGQQTWLPICHAYNAGPTFIQRLIDSSISVRQYETRLKTERPITHRYGEKVGRIYSVLRWTNRLWPY